MGPVGVAYIRVELWIALWCWKVRTPLFPVGTNRNPPCHAELEAENELKERLKKAKAKSKKIKAMPNSSKKKREYSCVTVRNSLLTLMAGQKKTPESTPQSTPRKTRSTPADYVDLGDEIPDE